MLHINGVVRYWDGPERLREVEKYIETRSIIDFSDMNGGMFAHTTREASYNLTRAYQRLLIENLTTIMSAQQYYDEIGQEYPQELINAALTLDSVFPT